MNWYEELKSYFPEEEMKSKAQLDCLLKERGDIYYKEEGPYHIAIYSEFPDFIFIDFLWVSEKSRGKGIGRKVIETLKEKNKPIIIEVEPIDKNEPDTERRLRFYRKLDFKLAESIDYMFQAFVAKSETKLEIMYWSNRDITEREIFENMNTVYKEIHTYKVEEIYQVVPKKAKEVIRLL
ncbi:GNAT family N-acetyltransferase [Ornithinibacillus scapharcae]|uniref:GNAT family N-acetyltransferase n=1 Tax=Ornithinibacillus scapharcae TaxID=1147159 RepID=UPI000225BA57|nr:GNAT family N-acetyltransferase [Ornithinibacillus scapharcae]